MSNSNPQRYIASENDDAAAHLDQKPSATIITKNMHDEVDLTIPRSGDSLLSPVGTIETRVIPREEYPDHALAPITIEGGKLAEFPGLRQADEKSRQTKDFSSVDTKYNPAEAISANSSCGNQSNDIRQVKKIDDLPDTVKSMNVLGKIKRAGKSQGVDTLPARARVISPSTRSKRRKGFLADILPNLEAGLMSLQQGSSTNKKTRLEVFSLKYNELSLAVIANWCKNRKGDSPLEVSYRNPTFRKCSICNLWGHYEIECLHQTPEMTQGFARYIKRMTSKKNNSAEESANADRIDPLNSFRKLNTGLTVEKCAGFLVEQGINAKSFASHGDSEATMLKRRKRCHLSKDTHIEGLTILEGVNALVLNQEMKNLTLSVGDTVVWFIADGNSTEDNKNVYAGKVLGLDFGASIATIQCIQKIPPFAMESSSCESDEIIGSVVNLPFSQFYTIDYSIDRNSYPKSGKETEKTPKDRIMIPKNPPRQREDGSYTQPQGRVPHGYQWDARKGLWRLEKFDV